MLHVFVNPYANDANGLIFLLLGFLRDFVWQLIFSLSSLFSLIFLRFGHTG